MSNSTIIDGKAFAEALRERIATAFRNAGAEAVQGFNLVLHGIIDPEDRPRFDVPGVGGPTAAARLKAGGKR